MSNDVLLHSIVKGIITNKRRWIFFSLAVISSLVCLIFTNYHYSDKYYGNSIMWIGWLASILFILIAFKPSLKQIKDKLDGYEKREIIIFLVLTAVFFITHFWNFKTAPWNLSGLFDDAAWDIYFSKNHIFTDSPFQPAFYDTIGHISREVGFHYYITIFFKLFGYNLLVFNISLAVLGFITYIFTALLIQKIFNNATVTVISALVFNFIPLHFLQTFAGHRYAIAAPLMMSSLYFIYTGYKYRSYFRIITGAVLTAFCVQSAVMGKHYVMALVGGFILTLVFDFKNSFNEENWKLTKVFVVSLVMAMLPLIVYVYHNPVYFRHEKDLTQQFLNTYFQSGFNQIKVEYLDRLKAVFFADFSYYRWFNSDFVTLPFVYYVFLIPGLLLGFIRKRFEVVIMALLPVAGAFISGAYDMRFLHSVPFWIVLMAFTFNEIVGIIRFKEIKKQKPIAYLTWSIMAVVLLSGLIPCITYLNSKSKDPNSIRLLPQLDVAVSRYVRDIAAGVPEPSTAFRHDELKKLEGYPEPDYDTFVCQQRGYAITHLFLQDYGDQRIMAFSNQLPYQLFHENEILNANINTILSYQKTDKDLKLVWETGPQVNRIIEAFRKFNHLGKDETVRATHADQGFNLYILTIDNVNIDTFKELIRNLKL